MAQLSPAQAKRRHPDEWIVMEVLEESKSGQVRKGKVVAHSKDRDDAYSALMSDDRYLYMFFGGDIPKKGYVFGFSLR